MLEVPVEITAAAGTSHAELLHSDDPLQALLPLSFRSSSDDPILRRLCPWFWKSIDIVGDVCIFGDPKATMSLQFAFALEALLVRKTKNVFWFGHDGAPATESGAGAGAAPRSDVGFASALSTDLTAWSRVLPVRAVDGDPAETCKLLTAPISLVWFDVSSGDVIRQVVEVIAPLIDRQAIIGIRSGGDGSSGTSTTVARLVETNRLVEVERHPADGIAFFHAVAGSTS